MVSMTRNRASPRSTVPLSPVHAMSSQARGRPPTAEITAPQRRTLSALRRFINRRGLPPTLKELADILGISGPSVRDQVNQLVRKGYVGSVAAVKPGPLLEVLRLDDQRFALPPVDRVPEPLAVHIRRVLRVEPDDARVVDHLEQVIMSAAAPAVIATSAVVSARRSMVVLQDS